MTEHRYFFFRLNSPRPTFPGDITDAEAAIMAEHAAYWRGLMPTGDIVVFGPVADPAGAWGLGVLRAESDEAARALVDRDPVVASGLSTIDMFPMLSAVVRGD